MYLANYAQWEDRSSLHTLPLSSEAIWIPTSSGEKAGNRRTQATPPSRCSTGDRSQQTPRTPWLRQNHFCLQKAVLDAMFPYGFAAMAGLSQTLPAECWRLWLKESIFYSHNQTLSVVLPAETSWRPWAGHLCTGSMLFVSLLLPGSFPYNKALEFTVLLQQNT